jgi:hypothetical protein
MYFQGSRYAIQFTSTALDAFIPVDDLGLFSRHAKYIVGTDFDAKAASDTQGRIVLQGDYISQISLSIHAI